MNECDHLSVQCSVIFDENNLIQVDVDSSEFSLFYQIVFLFEFFLMISFAGAGLAFYRIALFRLLCRRRRAAIAPEGLVV